MIVRARIVDYTGLDVAQNVRKWQESHSIDHNDFITALNNLAKQLGKPLLRKHTTIFYFDPEDYREVGLFLKFNDIEHKEIYRLLNTIGELVAPVFYVAPVFNLMQIPLKLNSEFFSRLIYHESRVHILTANAINLLYKALGVSQ